MTKKAPQISIPKTTKGPVAKAGKQPHPVLDGHQKLVDVMAEKKADITAAEGVLATSRKDLDPIVTKYRESLERDGIFTKTVVVRGSETNASYTFKDSYAKIDVSVEKDLQKLLGDQYDRLFTKKKTVAVKNACMDKLRALAQQHGFLDLLEEDEFLLPVDDFRQARFEARDQLSSAQNKALDDVVKQVSATPSLSFK